MQNYIEQLISDIHKATLRIRPPGDTWLETEADPDDEVALEDLSFIEKHSGIKEPISQITGIDGMMIPSAEKLSKEQQELLAIELEKLLEHFNFQLVFPENYPLHLKYPFIKDFWEEEHVALSFGMNEIEFCDMNDEAFCPFDGFCKICDENREQMKVDLEMEQRYRDNGSDLLDWPGDVEDFLPTKEEIEAFIKQQKELDGTVDEEHPFSIIYVKEELRFKMIDKQGNEIKHDDIPVPGRCTICRKYQADDLDEDILCLKTRYEQNGVDNFRCSMFKKM